MNHIAEFRDAIAATGLVAPDDIIDDGKIHRFSSSGRKSDTAGWYVLHGDGIPAGRFGCNRNTDIDVKWRANVSQELTAEQKQEYRAKMQAAKQQREAEQQREIARAAATAKRMWDQARPAEHAYLDAKGIPGVGVRVLDDVLLVPIKHSSSELVGLQRIYPTGEKKFIAGTPITGGYFSIGKPSDTFVICEGYATGVSIHQATSWPVVVAFNASNLKPVAQKIRARFPDARIIIAGDDDAWTRRPSGEAWNPGVEAAHDAARSIGALVCLPAWSGDRAKGRTDFNDLHADDGLDAVTACFSEPAAASVMQPVQPASDGEGFHPGSSASAEFSFPAEGAAVQHAADPAGLAGPDLPSDVFVNGQDQGDVFIYTATPMKTAEEFQRCLPADGKILFWRGEFYTWAGHRYAVRDAIYLHQLLYNFMARCLTHKTDPKTGDKEVVAFSPKKSAVEDVMHCLRAVCFVDLPEPPSWIEQDASDVPAGEIIAFRNGFLHWPTRTLLPSSHRLFIISALDFDFNPSASAPVEWLKFLAALWPSDPESIEALGDMFGYMLTDDTSQQKAFMMIGPPRSGKGTILRVLENLVGQHNRVSPSLASLGTQFGLQALVGKRVAMISDARLSGKTDQQPIVENILRITGEDALSVPRKYLGDWTGKLSTRFVLASNELPAFSDASAALANRFILFKFNTSFLGREDHGLTGRLMGELSGIVLWALEGLARLQTRGYLIEPAQSRDLADELREQSSPISAFIADRCILKAGVTVERGDIFAAWKEWCAAQGMDYAGTIIGFGRKLSAANASIGRSQPVENGVRLNLYQGIRLRSAFDHPVQENFENERPF